MAGSNHGYLDLGTWSGCRTAPTTCSNGMTISMWIKLTGPPNNTGQLLCVLTQFLSLLLQCILFSPITISLIPDSGNWGGIVSTLSVAPRPEGFIVEYKTDGPTATVYTVFEKNQGFYWGQAPLLTMDTWVHSVFVWDLGYNSFQILSYEKYSMILKSSSKWLNERVSLVDWHFATVLCILNFQLYNLSRYSSSWSIFLS